MKLIKTFEVGDIKREYFILDNKKAIALGWKFCIEVITTRTNNDLIVKNRYYCNTELGVHDGVNYWSKYSKSNNN
jgi:hypothetical protein